MKMIDAELEDIKGIEPFSCDWIVRTDREHATCLIK